MLRIIPTNEDLIGGFINLGLWLCTVSVLLSLPSGESKPNLQPNLKELRQGNIPMIKKKDITPMIQ